RLSAGRFEDGGEGVLAGVAAHKGVISWQARLTVTARERDRSCVAGDSVSRCVPGRDCKGIRHAGSSGRSISADYQTTGCRRRGQRLHFSGIIVIRIVAGQRMDLADNTDSEHRHSRPGKYVSDTGRSRDIIRVCRRERPTAYIGPGGTVGGSLQAEIIVKDSVVAGGVE